MGFFINVHCSYVICSVCGHRVVRDIAATTATLVSASYIFRPQFDGYTLTSDPDFILGMWFVL